MKMNFKFMVWLTVLVSANAFRDYRLNEEEHPRIRKRAVTVITTISPPATTTTKPFECTAIGKACDSDCKKIWTCINNGGEMKPILIAICNSTQTCNNGVCSNQPNAQCAGGGNQKFECRSEGVFPNPLLCTTYHHCVFDDRPGGANKLLNFERKCPSGRSYNPRTTYCDKALPNGTCPPNYPVPLCKNPGQTGALRENPSIYYICSPYEGTINVLYPYLYLCENGKLYDGNYGCR